MKLIDTDSALYQKRLVRELNCLPDGFYAPFATFNVRCNRARMVNSAVQCHSLSCSPEWFVPSRNEFEDVYGRAIVASRSSK